MLKFSVVLIRIRKYLITFWGEKVQKTETCENAKTFDEFWLKF